MAEQADVSTSEGDGFVRELLVVDVPREHHMEFRLALLDLLERCGVNKRVDQSSGANLNIAAALGAAVAWERRNYPAGRP